MPAPRLRRVGSKKEFENMLDDFAIQGYEIVEQGQTTAMVRRKTWGSAGGHVLWGLLTFWFTLGLGNLVYAIAAHYNAEKVMLKIDPSCEA